eukprot:3017372-Pyramimonas_sp.AAC.1
MKLATRAPSAPPPLAMAAGAAGPFAQATTELLRTAVVLAEGTGAGPNIGTGPNKQRGRMSAAAQKFGGRIEFSSGRAA